MSNFDLTQLIYVSSRSEIWGNNDLLSVKKTSEQNNSKNNITGILLSKEETFLQLLEGPKENIHSVYASIISDKRHKNIVKLMDEPVGNRIFDGWSMAVREVYNDHPLADTFMSFQHSIFSKNICTEGAEVALEIVNGFRLDKAFMEVDLVRS